MKRRPLSTYRLQLHDQFPFAAAEGVLGYLAELGITDVYTSPILRAETGSTHGYNVVDHGTIAPGLGGEEGYLRFSDALRGLGLGHVLDIVPNHMGIASGENAWWNDVLENGPAAQHADSFDIEWNPPKQSLKGRVLYPILGAQFGEVLENGELAVSREGGSFSLRYYDHRLPVAPRSVMPILEKAEASLALPEGSDARTELQSIVTALKHLPVQAETSEEKRVERAREKEVVKRRLDALCAHSPEVAAAIDASIARVNGKRGDRRSFDDLEALLQDQAYRLAFWRVATEEINYRRFFDVNQLVAVRMEIPSVFDAAHALLFRYIGEGRITGLRLDHTDGLYDPAAYFERLRASGAGDLYVIAEKILERGEKLPKSWRIEGTTGYDANASITGLWIDPDAEERLTSLYERVTGDGLDFDEHAYQGKRTVIRASFAGEANVLALQVERLAERNRRSRDFTLGSLTYALREVMATFPVYRTYLRPDGTRESTDERNLVKAVRAAKRRNPELDPSVFDFVRDVLLLRDLVGADEVAHEEQVRLVMRFQQLTSPIIAKGVEDTAFYRYNRLVALNEVGGEPATFGTAPATFHADNDERRRSWPLSMVTTSTHDTKRGEDVRARLGVLSEVPVLWEEAVVRWRAIADQLRERADEEPAPSYGDEYLFYQSAFGALPFAPCSPEVRRDLTARLVAYMNKAIKEAKLHTSWLNPSPDYEAAVGRFVEAMMQNDAFFDDLCALGARTASYAATNALAQVVLRATIPGVCDTYQGSESWNFSLVDPDNRRPVDYDHLRATLGSIRARMDDRLGLARELLGRFEDGAVKLYVTHALLTLRRAQPDLLIDGAYRPIEVGPHALAFAREHAGRTLVTAVPRLSYRLSQGRSPFPLGDVWEQARLEVGDGTYDNVLTGESLTARGGGLPMSDVLRHFPVAVLIGR